MTMPMSFSQLSIPFAAEYSTAGSKPIKVSARSSIPVVVRNFHSAEGGRLLLQGGFPNFCQRFCGLKLWILKSLKLQQCNRRSGTPKGLKTVVKNEDEDQYLKDLGRRSGRHGGKVSEEFPKLSITKDSIGETTNVASHLGDSDLPDFQPDVSPDVATLTGSSSSLLQKHPMTIPGGGGKTPSLCIAVIGATGELARGKIFPALFALYYSGFLPEDVGIFGYSRKNLTDEDLRSVIASNLTCRIDHQQNCGDKMEAFLYKTYHLDGGYDNREGMRKLNARMEQIEGESGANRIFYLSVPQEALLDVAFSLAEDAQTHKGWNRIIIEKPFGFDALSSHSLTKSLLSKFEENQLYRIDHLLGRNLIENLTVLRFSNLVFEPLWSRTHIRNVQVILSEDVGVQTSRYFDGYGIIRDIVHSHILQTIALLAMEPPISLDGEAIRNEKVKVLRSIRKLDPADVILGQYKATAGDKVNVNVNSQTPTYFAAALYIDNARWDGVPFLIKTGTGLIKHRVEIRIQFHHVPGNLYRERLGHNIDLATNELILRDLPDEAILIKINNKIPGLGLQLDTSELNLLYKDKYNIEVPDSYEHLLLDVIDGDNHLFLRSDELAVAWKILTPILEEIDKNHMAPELYEFGGRGPVGAYYLWAKHGVRWADD